MRMSELTFRVRIWQGEDGYLIAQCVELPAAIAQGGTKDEALQNVKEAIGLVVEDIEREFQEQALHTHIKVEETELVTVEAN